MAANSRMRTWTKLRQVVLPGMESQPTDWDEADLTSFKMKCSVAINLAAAFGQSLSSCLLSLASIQGLQMSFLSAVFGLLLGCSLFIYETQKTNTVRGTSFALALLNGLVFGGAFTGFYFLSFDYITLGDSRTLCFFFAFSASIILEFIMLKKAPHFLTFIAGVVGITGVMFLCQPKNLFSFSFEQNYLIGVTLACLSGSGGAVMYVNMKKMTTLPYSCQLISFFTGPFCFSLPFMIQNRFQFCFRSLFYSLSALSGAFSYAFFVYFAIIASQTSLPSVSFSLKLLGIVWAYVLQYCLLSENISVMSCMGAALVIASVSLQSFVVIKCSK